MTSYAVSPTALRASAVLELRRRERLRGRAEKIYGSYDAYRAAVVAAGLEAEQVANFERAGVVLQPKQMAFAAWARKMDNAPHIEGEAGSPELGMGGARGGGKSHALFVQVAIDDCQRYPGLKCLYIRQMGNKAVEQMEDLVSSTLGGIEHKYKVGLIRFPNGSSIRTGYFNNDKDAQVYLGLEYDLVVIEEATLLSFKAYLAMLQACRTSKEGWRPRVYSSTNPMGVGHMWYKKRFIDHERANEAVGARSRKFIPATLDDNIYIHADYEGNLEQLTGSEYRAYRWGDWDISAGAYFADWSYGRHVVPMLDRVEGEVWASMDYGYNHPNIILLHTKGADGVIITFHELVHRGMYPHEIAADLTRILELYGVKLSFMLAGSDVFNKTGQSQKTIAEQWAAAGYHLRKADTAAGSRIGGAQHLARLLGNHERGMAPGWFVTANCLRLIDTIPYLERDPNNAEDVRKVDADGDGRGGDDAYDCARYGLYAKRVMFGEGRAVERSLFD